MKRHIEVPNVSISMNDSVRSFHLLPSTMPGALHALSHLILIEAVGLLSSTPILLMRTLRSTEFILRVMKQSSGRAES